MLLKRMYAPEELARHEAERARAAKEGRDPSPAQVDHVLVKHTGTSPEQNFSHRFVEQGVVDGWVDLSDHTLVIRAKPEDLSYTLKRRPGYYCVSTGERIPITSFAWNSSSRGVLARREVIRWLEAHGKAADDYEVTNAYECVLSSAQHEKFRAVQDAKGRIVGAHTLEA